MAKQQCATAPWTSPVYLRLEHAQLPGDFGGLGSKYLPVMLGQSTPDWCLMCQCSVHTHIPQSLRESRLPSSVFGRDWRGKGVMAPALAGAS